MLFKKTMNNDFTVPMLLHVLCLYFNTFWQIFGAVGEAALAADWIAASISYWGGYASSQLNYGFPDDWRVPGF